MNSKSWFNLYVYIYAYYMNMYIHRCTHLTCDRMIVHLIHIYIYIQHTHIYIYSYYPPKAGIIVKITLILSTLLPSLRSLRLDSSERWLLRSQKKPQRFRKARVDLGGCISIAGAAPGQGFVLNWMPQMFLGELKPRLPVAWYMPEMFCLFSRVDGRYMEKNIWYTVYGTVDMCKLDFLVCLSPQGRGCCSDATDSGSGWGIGLEISHGPGLLPLSGGSTWDGPLQLGKKGGGLSSRAA